MADGKPSFAQRAASNIADAAGLGNDRWRRVGVDGGRRHGGGESSIVTGVVKAMSCVSRLSLGVGLSGVMFGWSEASSFCLVGWLP